MSKLIKNVVSAMNNDGRCIRAPRMFASVKLQDTRELTMAQAYKCEVRWTQAGYCDPNNLPMLRKNFIGFLREEIYGEFREPLLELERAIYEEDFRTAADIFQHIMKIIYSEE